MLRLRTLHLRLSLLLISVPGSAISHVEMTRPPAPIPVRQFAQLTSDPGIECISSDLSMVLGLGVYSVVTGERLATFPTPFNDPLTTFTLRDFDGDNIDEALSIYSSGVLGAGAKVGLTQHSVSIMARVFPDLDFAGEPSLEFVETMHLNVSETRAFVLAGRGVHIVSRSGELLYTSATDPAYPLSSGNPSVTIDDFDGDGFDEVAASFTSSPSAPSLVLIGDSAPTVGVDSRLAARPMLFAARPNPSAGPARIAFELPAAARVRLRIYDAAGRLVSRLVDGPMTGGRHDFVWSGDDDAGRRVSNGLYFTELEVDGVKESRRMVQLR